MLSNLTLGIIVLCFIGALIRSEVKAKKKYIIESQKAMIEQTSLISNYEKLVKNSSLLILVSLCFYIFISSVFYHTNGNVIFAIAILYMISYYWLEYLPHSSWCITEHNILCKRNLMPIVWENIVSYRWINGKRLILQICYKGKGITNRRCELYVKEEDQSMLSALLKDHYIVELE